MSITIFHCSLCPKDARDGIPEFVDDVDMTKHLATVHQVPGPYVCLFRELRQPIDADLTVFDVKDGTGRTVGVAINVLRRGGV